MNDSMISRVRSILFTPGVALVVALTLWAAAPARGQALQARLDTLVSNSRVADTKLGICIINCATDTVLASRNPDQPMVPASNMKLLTSGAAIAVLGPDHVFRSELLYQPADGSTPERLILRGSGDPALADPKLLDQMGIDANKLINTWAEAAKQAGASAPEVVIDDRVFDRQYVHPTWPTNQLNRWYCAEVYGFNFHTNLLAVFTDPREAGRPPKLSTEPSAPWIQIVNKARSVTSGAHTAWVSRPGPENVLTLAGDVRYSVDPVEVAMHDFQSIVGRSLADRLRELGLKPTGVRLAAADDDFSRATVIHAVETALPTVLARCNKDSYNLYAEALLKKIGHAVTGSPGSWSNGATVLRMVLLEKLGPASGQMISIADGSGMSQENRVTPRMLAAWLQALQADPRIGPTFLESLPLAGEEGTLRRRFREHNIAIKHDVRAKTGFIAKVSSLSGYVTSTDGRRRVAFSIIANDKPNRVPLKSVWELQERIVQIIDQWISRKE